MAINTALIQGAATAAGPVVDYFGSFSQGFDSTFEPLMEMAKLKLLEEKEKKQAEDAKMIKYLEGLEDVDIAGLTQLEQMEVAKVGLQWKKDYSEIAGQLSQVSASENPELYMELSSKLNAINNKFINLTNNFKTYKANKLDYADSLKNNEFSLINGDKIKQANDYYTGNIKIDYETGNATWGDLTEAPVLAKKEKAIIVGNQIKQTIKEIKKLKRPLTELEKKEYYNDLKAVITPEIAAMIVKDDAIPGVDSSLFLDILIGENLAKNAGALGFENLFDIENSANLREQVISRLTNGFVDVASNSYAIKTKEDEDKLKAELFETELKTELREKIKRKYAKRKKPKEKDKTIKNNAINLVNNLIDDPNGTIDLILGPGYQRVINGSFIELDLGDGETESFNIEDENQLKNLAVRLSNAQGYTVGEKTESRNEIVEYVNSLVPKVVTVNPNPDDDSPENYIYLSDDELDDSLE